jgi:transcriptional regulatory protein RtcR
MRRNVVLGLLGTTLDAGHGPKRWERWRPSIGVCQHEDLLVDRFELLCQKKYNAMAKAVIGDIRSVSPETQVRVQEIEFADPWDFQEVYAALHDFARGYAFNTDENEYLIHITTGTHVAQICLFLLTESRHFPAKLIQTSPPRRDEKELGGRYSIIDLDLSKYDSIASRFRKEQQEAVSLLKSGIETRNVRFNQLIERIEKVAVASRAPILLMGPTGAGKSRLARRIFELKKARRQIDGSFVEVNCATVRGDGAMSTLFGHKKGAFTGATSDRPGLLKAANKGILFLDEIGELGPDEQAMLLRALEEKVFLPLGSDTEAGSDFMLIAGTNMDLHAAVEQGHFREDLLARINLWTFYLPGLRERLEDIEPNVHYELEQFSTAAGTRVTFNKEARDAFLKFTSSSEARWSGNFRDLNSAVVRMATLAAASGGRISVELVDEELDRLRRQWAVRGALESGMRHGTDALEEVLGKEGAAALDRFDRVQLADVLSVCRGARSLSEAGRILFAETRKKKLLANDADRLRKYLARFGLDWSRIRNSAE